MSSPVPKKWHVYSPNMVVKWTKTALVNLDLIAEYIAKNNPARAISFVQEIQQKTKLITDFQVLDELGAWQAHESL